jgi:hypothetical protein
MIPTGMKGILRNPQESSGMRQESSGILRNETGIFRNNWIPVGMELDYAGMA